MISPIINKTPTSFEIWILKWIFLPLIALGLILYVWDAVYGKYECNSICKEKGFYESNYSAKSFGRVGLVTGDKCFCLTEEQASLENKFNIGARVY